jgi:type VI secretion system protein ImpK
MSDEDKPFEGPSDRTILAPGPKAWPRMPPAPGPAFRPAAPPRPEPCFAPRPAADAATGEAALETEEVPPIRLEPPPSSLHALRFDARVVAHQNGFIPAAGPVLVLLGGLQVAVPQASSAKLMERVALAIENFETEARGADVAADQARDATYILCAMADDRIQNIPTLDRHARTHGSMLFRFFGERTGGDVFFAKLDRAKLGPLRSYALLELMHCCLALGFQGRYRTLPEATATLQKIQRDLYDLLRKVRPRAERDLSPHWKGQELDHPEPRARSPFWAIAGVAGIALLGLFLSLRSVLTDAAEIAATEIRNLDGTGRIGLARASRVPPPPAPPGPVCPTDLPEGFTCKMVGTGLTFSAASEVVFASGQVSVNTELVPVVEGLARFLDKWPGTIGVIGHTDNVKLRKTSPFASNWALSLERAKAVAAILKPSLTDPSRIEVEGRADEVPLASNDTPEGRTRNRRVEIELVHGSR